MKRNPTIPLSIFFFLLSIFFFVYSLSIAQTFTGIQADKLIKGSDKVIMETFTAVPNLVKFNQDYYLPESEIESWIMNQLGFSKDMSLKLLNKETDALRMTHYRYQQVYKGVPVAFTMYIAHVKAGKVVSMNGHLFDQIASVSEVAKLDEAKALEAALAHIGASVYKWQIPEEEAHLRMETENPRASYLPKGELVIVPQHADLKNLQLRLAYKFNIYAQEPLSRSDVYVDAINGKIIFENHIIHTSDVQATAVTRYSGNKNITTDSYSGKFRLRESGRGKGIRTFDMNEGTSYGSAVDFTDTDNHWDNFNSNEDEVATDAHWGSEMTYDYFFQKHNRNSIDNKGFQLNSYIHYKQNYANAFWDGFRMTYGDGSGGISPLTAIDIAGHEVTHGLTSYTADLQYSNESGALNESFSDIFGTAIEFFGKGASADWLIGKDIGHIMRNMANPNATPTPKPDTYKGNYWVSGSSDHGGVHTNSSVQNHWFYLLSVGANGTNDNGDAFDIIGIGMDKAEKIAFRNLTLYLTPLSKYSNARSYAIQAAEDLFGDCSPEVEACTNAWHAVGVGNKHDSPSAFVSHITTSCNFPFTVNFTSTGTGASNYVWDFGDGNTSTQQNPGHTYDTYQPSFTVKLTVNSVSCGTHSTTKTNHILINPAAAPATGDDYIKKLQSAHLTVTPNSQGGTINWYDSPTGGTAFHTGNSYTTPVLTQTTTYYVQEITNSNPQNIGKDDNSGGGGYYQYDQSLIFDASKQFELKSVKVYAGSSGNRTIELRDAAGVVLQSKTVYIGQGEQRVSLNFNVPSGSNYHLGVPSGATPDLYRNNAGNNYPYTIQGLASIKESSASSNPTGYYYFFYEWEVQEPSCSSLRTPVTAHIGAPQGVEEIMGLQFLTLAPNPTKGVSALNFNLEQDENTVLIRVIDLQGRVIKKVLEEGRLLKGEHLIHLDLYGISEGIYECQIITEKGSVSKKLMLLN